MSRALQNLTDDWERFEAQVDATPGIDHWCSGPDWVIPSHRAFAPEATPVVIDGPDGSGRAVLARYDHVPSAEGDATILAGLEPLWGFACPVVGAAPAAFAPHLADTLLAEPWWDRLILPGFPPDLELLRTIGLAFARDTTSDDRAVDVGVASGITRCVADLGGGLDPWWDRRRPRFRRNLRNATRRAQTSGVSFHDASDDDHLFDRIEAIERRSWKGLQNDGICSPPMGAFYRTMIDRLAERGRVRASVAVRNGRDIGFILGGIRNDTYRGLQLSYAEEAADLSLSNLLQLREIETLAAGNVTHYDLGMDMDYKRGWSDDAIESLTLVVERSAGHGAGLAP